MPIPKRKLALGAFLAAVAAVAVIWPQGASADPLADFAEKEKRLNAKAAQVESLEDKLALLDETVEARLEALADIRTKITEIRRELTEATDALTALSDRRDHTMGSLGKVVRVDYLGGSPGAWEVLAGPGSASGLLTEQTATGSLGDYALALADDLAESGEKIEQQRRTLLSRTRHLEELETAADRHVRELSAVRGVKADLLRATRGEEDRFRGQYETAREKLVQLGIFGRSGCSRVGDAVRDDVPGYFNQCDSRWADATLGFSDSTIGDYGCGVASAAMVFERHGIDTDPQRLNDALKRVGAFQGDLLYWSSVHRASGGALDLVNKDPNGRVDWSVIDRQISRGNPVIVWVDRPGQYNHYVVLLEKKNGHYMMHDPIEGPNRRFENYYSTGAVVQYIALEPA